MRRILLGLFSCAGLLSCTVTKRDGGDNSWRSDASVTAVPETATAPDEFPTTSSAAPSVSEWDHSTRLTLEGVEAPCSAWRVREWLRVSCVGKDRPMEGVQLNHSRGWGSDVSTVDTPELASAILPVRRGGDIQLSFLLPDGARELWVLWSSGSRPSINFKKQVPAPDKLRCTGPSKSGPCCYRAFSGTSFHPELQCDTTRYQEICASNADCDTTRTKRVCKPGPAGANLKLCALP